MIAKPRFLEAARVCGESSYTMQSTVFMTKTQFQTYNYKDQHLGRFTSLQTEIKMARSV